MKEVKLEFYIFFGFCLGDVVIDVKGLIKVYDGCILFENFDVFIFKNVIVGIIGLNGVGKSIFFCIFMGKE